LTADAEDGSAAGMGSASAGFLTTLIVAGDLGAAFDDADPAAALVAAVEEAEVDAGAEVDATEDFLAGPGLLGCVFSVIR